MADGAIVIDTKIDQGGFNAGLKKLQSSALTALNTVLFSVAKIGTGIKATMQKVISTVAGLVKNVLTGALVLFALSFQKIIASLRESMTDVFKLRGGDTERQIEEIQNSFVDLRAAIANAFLPLIEAAIPYIKQAISWLIELFNKAAMITAAFMGQKQALQIIQGSAQKIADANKKTEKAAKNQLAAFDQINTLQKPDSGTDVGDLPKVAGELVPVTDDILSKVQEIKDEIAAWFADPIGKLQETWGKIVEWFRANVLDPIVQWWNNTWIGQLLNRLWENFTGTWARIFENTKATFQAVKDAAELYFQGVIEYITGIFTGDWGLAWEGIKHMAEGAWGALWAFIKGGFENWFLLVSGWANHVKILFEELFGPVIGNALKWVQDKFVSVWTGIQNFVQTTINNILGFINSLIDSIMSAISAISGLNLPGATGGAMATVNARPPRMPGLATGAVIPPNAAFAAILGDQKSGYNIEAPAAMFEEMLNRAVAGGQQNITIEFTGSLSELARVLKPKIDQENRRVGGSLVR